jgi:hypothetical protein
VGYAWVSGRLRPLELSRGSVAWLEQSCGRLPGFVVGRPARARTNLPGPTARRRACAVCCCRLQPAPRVLCGGAPCLRSPPAVRRCSPSVARTLEAVQMRPRAPMAPAQAWLPTSRTYCAGSLLRAAAVPTRQGVRAIPRVEPHEPQGPSRGLAGCWAEAARGASAARPWSPCRRARRRRWRQSRAWAAGAGPRFGLPRRQSPRGRQRAARRGARVGDQAACACGSGTVY